MSETSLRDQFFNDSLELLADAEEYVLQLEKEGFDKDTVHSLFRLFHTLKGNSNMVGEGEISSLTHALESEYDAVRNEKAELSEGLLQTTFEVMDLLTFVCQEGDSSPYKEKIVDMTDKFGSPLQEEKGEPQIHLSDHEQSGGGSSGREASEGGGRKTGGEQRGDAQGARKDLGQQDLRQEEGPRDFDNWRPILAAFYTLEKYAWKMAELGTEEGWEDTLMDLGMAAIELRSTLEDNLEFLQRTAVYMEKFVSTLSREQLPYSEIGYELLFLLLNDFRRYMWERLYGLGVFRHYRIDSTEALEGLVDRLGEEGVLYIVELTFKRETFLREGPLFNKLEKVKQAAPNRVVFISPRIPLMQKATALLDQALEGFPQIAMDIEEGVRTLLVTEE